MKFLLLAVFCVSQVLCADDWFLPYELHDSDWNEEAGVDTDLVEVAKNLKLKKFVKYLIFSGLADTIKTGGSFTIFAPTDKAFDELLICPYLRKELFGNKTRTAELLKYHTISGEVLSTQLSNELLAPSLFKVGGKPIYIRVNIYDQGKVITATGSPVVNVDQKASNGVIHVIDKMMFRVPVSDMFTVLGKAKKVASTLVSAIKLAGLDKTLQGKGPFTLFAPSNKAFAKLPKETLNSLFKNKTALADVLTYHLISGTFYSDGIDSGDSNVPSIEGKTLKLRKSPYTGRVYVNGIRAWGLNLSVSNGVVHVIDTILMPPAATETTPETNSLPWMQLDGVEQMEQFDRL